jgi:hypothetical protein
MILGVSSSAAWRLGVQSVRQLFPSHFFRSIDRVNHQDAEEETPSAQMAVPPWSRHTEKCEMRYCHRWKPMHTDEMRNRGNAIICDRFYSYHQVSRKQEKKINRR